jgi:DNA-binding PadR family transcriptional regulator
MTRKHIESQLAVSRLTLTSVRDFFQSPPPTYLNKEQAVCYILSVLLQGDSYGTELMSQLEENFPTYRLSDTVLYSALIFLEKEEITIAYWQKTEGRGRPRRMYSLAAQWREEAQALAHFWASCSRPVVDHKLNDVCQPLEDIIYFLETIQESPDYVAISERLLEKKTPITLEFTICRLKQIQRATHKNILTDLKTIAPKR